mgnify:FL=1
MSVMTRAELRIRRHLRMRRKVLGTSERPRLAVFRSLNHIYCQVVDDTKGRTLLALSSLSPDLKKALPKGGGNRAAAELLGKNLAERALKVGIQRVVFDRGGFRYHGRVMALADAARKGGLSL